MNPTRTIHLAGLTAQERQDLLVGLTRVRRRKTTRVAITGPFRSECRTCGQRFHTSAAEGRHLAPGHNVFRTLTEGDAP